MHDLTQYDFKRGGRSLVEIKPRLEASYLKLLNLIRSFPKLQDLGLSIVAEESNERSLKLTSLIGGIRTKLSFAVSGNELRGVLLFLGEFHSGERKDEEPLSFLTFNRHAEYSDECGTDLRTDFDSAPNAVAIAEVLIAVLAAQLRFEVQRTQKCIDTVQHNSNLVEAQ